MVQVLVRILYSAQRKSTTWRKEKRALCTVGYNDCEYSYCKEQCKSARLFSDGIGSVLLCEIQRKTIDMYLSIKHEILHWVNTTYSYIKHFLIYHWNIRIKCYFIDEFFLVAILCKLLRYVLWKDMTWSINETNIVKQEFLSTKNSIKWFLIYQWDCGQQD